MIKAIFFDIDGTLTSFRTHQIPDEVFAALYQLKTNGIRLFIATGRGKDGLSVLKGFPFDGYITLNGQLCFTAEDEIILENFLQKEDLKIILQECSRDPFACAFTMPHKKVFNFRNSQVEEIHAITHNDDHPAGDLRNILSEKVYQVMAFIDENREMQLMAKLKGCTSARWHPYFTDISPLGGTKVRGIDSFLSFYGIDLNETMSFGDGGNDFAMLKHTAVSVAMGDSADILKEAADYVTASVDHSGILQALQYYHLL